MCDSQVVLPANLEGWPCPPLLMPLSFLQMMHPTGVVAICNACVGLKLEMSESRLFLVSLLVYWFESQKQGEELRYLGEALRGASWGGLRIWYSRHVQQDPEAESGQAGGRCHPFTSPSNLSLKESWKNDQIEDGAMKTRWNILNHAVISKFFLYCKIKWINSSFPLSNETFIIKLWPHIAKMRT